MAGKTTTNGLDGNETNSEAALRRPRAADHAAHQALLTPGAIGGRMMAIEPVALTVGDRATDREAHRAAASALPTGGALKVSGVTKVFGGAPTVWQRVRRRTGDAKRVLAVDDVTFEVDRREIFGILGPNGTGKSTLIRLISTLLIPDSGEIAIFGRDVVRDEPDVKRMINRVSVEASFFKKLTPMENLMYAARLYRVDAREARRMIIEILKRLGLEDRSVFAPMEDMSRGMQQKVAIARAFLSAPILLLLDEPTTGLDPFSKREVQAFVCEMRDTHDTTVLLTTHDMYEADALCDRIAIIDQGRIVALDTPRGLKALVRRNGNEPTLEEVFLELTGHKLKDENQGQEPEE
jgi:ABC-2 type transport system ATP-binding protein